MPCNCESDNNDAVNVEVLDATGQRYIGVLYAGIVDFTNWFESKSATFHVEVHSKAVTGDESIYSAHSLPMIGISPKIDTQSEETPDMIINLEKDNSYLTLTSTGQKHRLGFKHG